MDTDEPKAMWTPPGTYRDAKGFLRHKKSNGLYGLTYSPNGSRSQGNADSGPATKAERLRNVEIYRKRAIDRKAYGTDRDGTIDTMSIFEADLDELMAKDGWDLDDIERYIELTKGA